jgi:hypothetical protein
MVVASSNISTTIRKGFGSGNGQWELGRLQMVDLLGQSLGRAKQTLVVPVMVWHYLKNKKGCTKAFAEAQPYVCNCKRKLYFFQKGS